MGSGCHEVPRFAASGASGVHRFRVPCGAMLRGENLGSIASQTPQAAKHALQERQGQGTEQEDDDDS